MRLRQLFEEANRVLYHLTSLWALNKIFQEGRIGLTYATGSDIQAGSHNQKMYFLSTTRSKVGHYTVAHEGSSSSVLMVLDADFLSRTLQIKPVDYWGRDFRNLDAKRNEMEERVYSSRPYISLPEKPSDLIVATHLYVTKPDGRFRQMLIDLIKGSKRLGVPFYTYQNKRAWLLQDTRRALSTADLIGIIRASPIETPYAGTSFRRPSEFGGFVELFIRPVEDRSRLTQKGQYVLRYITPWGIANGEATTSVNAMVHGARSPGSPRHQDLVDFVGFMRRAGFSSVKDFLTALSQKWYPETR